MYPVSMERFLQESIKGKKKRLIVLKEETAVLELELLNAERTLKEIQNGDCSDDLKRGLKTLGISLLNSGSSLDKKRSRLSQPVVQEYKP